ncbi:Omp28-related outer membrane protein, partial [Bacteroidota bacterium]
YLTSTHLSFDTLSYGDYIAVKDPAWTTWSNNPGSTEDAKVDTLESNSPNNSIYFASTAASGGPQDVVLEFGSAFNTGEFEFEMAMFIKQGKGAYFNFQAETTIGTTWALDCHFIQDSVMHIVDQSKTYFSTSYPVENWFDFKLLVNLNTNVWEVYLDNVLKGTFQNTENKIASLDLFPLCQADFGGNGLSNFWVDDVGFTHVPYTLPTVNGGVYRIDFEQVTINGVNNTPIVQVRNLGATTISSFELKVDYNGNQITKNVTAVSIPSLGTYEVDITPGFVIDNNATSIIASLTSVNGVSGDGDSTDDSKTLNFIPIIPVTGKLVIVEEATGTWCGWCPRGTVAMDFLARDYHGYAQGIAVHNGDPMVNTIYDAGINNYITGYPSALVERGNSMNPSIIWETVNDGLKTSPAAFLVNGAKYNSGTQLLEVSVTTNFINAANNNWKMACVLVEDSVTGTSSGYAQSNSYSGGGSGTLIGPDGIDWSLLPSPVPASQMVYNHVARIISPSFGGHPNSFPAIVDSGDAFTFNFDLIIDQNWDTANMHIVGMLIKPDGTIDNGSTSTIGHAIENGFVPGTNISGVEILAGPDSKVKMFPNPTTLDYTTLQFYNINQKVKIDVTDISGKLISSYSYGITQDNQKVQLDTKNLANGVYIVQITMDNSIESHRLIVK